LLQQNHKLKSGEIFSNIQKTSIYHYTINIIALNFFAGKHRNAVGEFNLSPDSIAVQAELTKT